MAFLASKRVLRVYTNVCINCCRYSYSDHIKAILNSMPKDNSKLVKQLRENRIKSAVKAVNANKYASNVVQLHILGNGAKGNPKAVYVSTDRLTYLFNCGEGTQRLAHEHGLRLSKLQHILLTQRSSENLSGVVGLALTCQDIGVPSLTFHGPPDIDKIFQLYKYFITTTGMKIESHHYLENVYEDNEMQIKCIPIFKCEKLFDRRDATNVLTSEEIAFAFVCKLKPRPGELMISKCIELKIPAGPLLGKLKSGEDIVLADNRVIRSKDVVAPEEVGPIFVVLECPSVDYINSLLLNDEWQHYQNLLEDISKLVVVVVHFSPPEVINDDRYQKWMYSFSDNVTHIVCNEQNPVQSFIGVNKLQIQLNLVDSDVFPLLNCVRSQSYNSAQLSNKIIFSPTLLKYHLRPSNLRGIDNETLLSIDSEAIRNETISNKEFVEYLNIYRQKTAAINSETHEYPEIIFLGTGSAMPSKIRNTSAIWVNISASTSLLLDCGEGTCGQLYRFFGDDFESKLKSLKAIYVSHLHADHHLGLLQIIKKRYLLSNKPLILIIPPAVNKWLINYNNSVENISGIYRAFPCEQFLKQSDSKLLKKLELSDLRTVNVMHCTHSYGIIFSTECEPKYKIVYSGDAMPTESLVKAGMNCDLLIHEATMEDELEDDARLKFHSTTSQAIDMGIKMNAKFTILTHFSQRYSKIPVFNDKFNDNVGIAFDNMKIRMNNLNKLSLMIPSLKCLFSEQLEQLQEKTAYNIKRREIINKHMECIK